MNMEHIRSILLKDRERSAVRTLYYIESSPLWALITALGYVWHSSTKEFDCYERSNSKFVYICKTTGCFVEAEELIKNEADIWNLRPQRYEDLESSLFHKERL